MSLAMCADDRVVENQREGTVSICREMLGGAPNTWQCTRQPSPRKTHSLPNINTQVLRSLIKRNMARYCSKVIMAPHLNFSLRKANQNKNELHFLPVEQQSPTEVVSHCWQRWWKVPAPIGRIYLSLFLFKSLPSLDSHLIWKHWYA